MRLFWSVTQEELGLWGSQFNLGVRSGWKVVRLARRRAHPIQRFFEGMMGEDEE